MEQTEHGKETFEKLKQIHIPDIRFKKEKMEEFKEWILLIQKKWKKNKLKQKMLYKMSSLYEEIMKIEIQVEKSKKKITGLEKNQSKKMNEEKANRLKELLSKSRIEYENNQKKLEEIHEKSKEKTEFDLISQNKIDFEEKIGLTQLANEISDIKSSLGVSRSNRGDEFEKEVKNLIEEKILSQYISKLDQDDINNGSSLKLLSNVSLGAARGEIDYLVAQIKKNPQFKPPKKPNQTISKQKLVKTAEFIVEKVHAIIEVKNNFDDFGYGFEKKQEMLHFLTDDFENPEDYKMFINKIYPKGRFTEDINVVHREKKKEKYLFTRKSFENMFPKEKEGYFIQNCFYITHIPKYSFGTKGQFSIMIASKIYSDFQFNLEDENYLNELFDFVTSFEMDPLIDKLQIYLKNPSWCQFIYLLKKKRKQESKENEQENEQEKEKEK
ncbi:stress response protein nst1 [Anaeramoeba ignava]|uniref:Stress response protein nst1 n=1 Tax=Anaeramoeba ignava TaxID=1746090 RepID=A0A9Q0R767_ANAIG|nr:stress response protein nst1 [Anaeramoeba ignava]